MAEIYDWLVAGVDFEGWIDYAEALARKFGHRPGEVVDLACGTGNTTLPFARRGYRATGVDLSPEMIAIARAKAQAEGLDVNFLCQDIRNLELPEAVPMMTAFHDGLNYLLDYGDLCLALERISANLLPGGIFIFDLNAVCWLRGARRETAVIDEGDFTLIWNSDYDWENDIWQVFLTGFVRRGELYRKFTEVHRVKAYGFQEVKTALSSAGLKLLGVFDAFTFNPPHEKSRRHFYVAEKEK